MVFTPQVSEYDRWLTQTQAARSPGVPVANSYAHVYLRMPPPFATQTDLFFQKRQLEFALRPEHADALQQVKDRSSSQLTEKIKTRLKRKFDQFLQRRTGTSPTHHASDKWVTNLFSRQLSPAETSVLSKGLNKLHTVIILNTTGIPSNLYHQVTSFSGVAINKIFSLSIFCCHKSCNRLVHYNRDIRAAHHIRKGTRLSPSLLFIVVMWGSL